MRGQALFAAALCGAALLAAPQASAQSYGSYHNEHVARHEQCRDSRNNRTAAGAAIGGVAGAVLGSQVAARGHRTDGSVLGAVVGAVAGGMIGRQTANNCDQRVQGAYDPYYGQPSGYGDDSGLYGGPYRQTGYGNSNYGRDCRMGEVITRDPYGREYREDVWMCRANDGQWYPERG